MTEVTNNVQPCNLDSTITAFVSQRGAKRWLYATVLLNQLPAENLCISLRHTDKWKNYLSPVAILNNKRMACGASSKFESTVIPVKKLQLVWNSDTWVILKYLDRASHRRKELDRPQRIIKCRGKERWLRTWTVQANAQCCKTNLVFDIICTNSTKHVNAFLSPIDDDRGSLGFPSLDRQIQNGSQNGKGTPNHVDGEPGSVSPESKLNTANNQKDQGNN